ncbi:MAG TPA: phytanoyl-CoA dioxygenase family protein [Acidimicrobiales bacterium]|nr:phytanoyl-CoA dioxygenase family protein [Acidimicrobiales bacterium]
MGLEHFATTATTEDIHAALVRDGACIVDDVLDELTLEALRGELDGPLAETGPGSDEFSGLSTRRFGSLIERVPSSRQLVMHPLVLEVTGKLLSHATTVQLHLTQAICIGPNSPAQLIHRDQWAFDFFEFPAGFDVQCNTIWAITDFTEDNGATRVAVGSNHGADKQRLDQSDTVAATMRAGSVVLYTGSVYHGGGANTTADETRIGINITYNVGWLRQEENQYLAVSRECAATLEEPLLRLMGYQRGAYALGYIDDLRDPITVIRPDLATADGFAAKS